MPKMNQEQLSRIHNRDIFLNNIASKLQRERIHQNVERPALKHDCHHQVMGDFSLDQLKAVLFEYAINALGAKVEITTKAQLSNTLRLECLSYCGLDSDKPQEILFSADVRLLDLIDLGLFSDAEYDLNIWDNEAGYDRNIVLAERAKVGVVFAEQVLAESGTMVLYSQSKQGQVISLLPEASIFIVPKSALVARLTQATEKLHQKVVAGERIPSCVNFISGLSLIHI